MPTIYGAIDLVKNEIRNAVMQNLGSAPAAPVKGLMYFDTTANILYWYNGTTWIAAQSGASLNPATTVTTQAIGDAPVVGTLASYAREDHTHGTPTHVNADHAAINHSALAPPTADVSWGGFKLTNLGTPVATTDASTKGYVDSAITGLSWKDACKAA